MPATSATMAPVTGRAGAGAATSRQRGFTLFELIVVVIIASVIAAIAAPNLSEFVKNNARTTGVNTMVTALNYSRSQAVSRNTRVSLCRSAAFVNCDGIGSGEFETGWIVFTDGNPRGTVEGTDAVLRVFQPEMGATATLRGSNGAIGAIGGVSYENNGLGWDLNPPGGAAAVSANTVIRYCDDRGASEALGIVISPTGFPSLTKDTNGDGTHDIGGVALVCP